MTYNEKKANTEILKSKFGDNLNKAIKEKGYTKEEFSSDLNVSTRIVYDWISGVKVPTLIRTVEICRLLDISLDRLVR